MSHYIINLTEEPPKSIYKIGDKTFSSMKELLTFYKQRLLDTSPLVRIVRVPLGQQRRSFSLSLSSSIRNCAFEQSTNSMARCVGSPSQLSRLDRVLNIGRRRFAIQKGTNSDDCQKSRTLMVARTQQHGRQRHDSRQLRGIRSVTFVHRSRASSTFD